ncbi:hypothetical protein Tco_1088823 [Tanacetum coccineum]
MVESEKGKVVSDDLSMVESAKGKGKLMVSDEMVDYVLEKYGNKWKCKDEIADVILEDLRIKYGKLDDLQNRVERLEGDLARAEKGKAKLMLTEVVEASSDEEDSSDECFFGNEDLVLFNDVKYPLRDAEIRMFKERPTTSRVPTASTSTSSRAPTASTRSIAPIASTSNAQVAFTAPRGYRKIAMTSGVLALKAPNDLNAPPPLTTRKRKLLGSLKVPIM